MGNCFYNRWSSSMYVNTVSLSSVLMAKSRYVQLMLQVLSMAAQWQTMEHIWRLSFATLEPKLSLTQPFLIYYRTKHFSSRVCSKILLATHTRFVWVEWQHESLSALKVWNENGSRVILKVQRQHNLWRIWQEEDHLEFNADSLVQNYQALTVKSDVSKLSKSACAARLHWLEIH